MPIFPRLMKRLPKLAVASAASVIMASGVVAAQDISSDVVPAVSEATAEQFQQRMADMAARLNLTDEQKTALDPIIRDSVEKRMAAMTKAGLGEGERPNPRALMGFRSEMQALSSDTQTQVAEILTEEQMAEFEVMQAEAQDQMREQIQARMGR